MDTKTARIRALNDQLRQHLTGGMAVITPGVAALGLKTIAVFDDFCRANDPYEEHDLARLTWMDTRSCSRSIISIRPCQCTRWIRLILLSLNGHHDYARGGVLETSN